MLSSQQFCRYVLTLALIFGSGDCLCNAKISLGDDRLVQITDNLPAFAETAVSNNSPIVILLERSDCDYCKTVNREFITPLSKASRYQGLVFFTRVSLDDGEVVIGFDHQPISANKFGGLYDAKFTPTILFLDGYGTQLSDKLVGLGSIDFYGFYLEKGIQESIDKLRSNSNG